MAKCNHVEETKMKPIMELTPDIIKDLKELNIDDELVLQSKVKVVSVSRDQYEKNKPLKGRAEILSTKIMNSKIKEKIEDAKSEADMKKIEKELK